MSEMMPPYSNPTTSYAAAVAMIPFAKTLRERVWNAILAAGPDGHTDDELIALLGIEAHTQNPRRRELVQQGLVVNSGHTRKTRKGRKAMVWVAVQFHTATTVASTACLPAPMGFS